MNRTVVLGAGPVGLVAAAILRADLVIGDNVGGDSRLRELAPTYLWRTPATERLLKEVGGGGFRPRTVRFGWIAPGGEVVDRVPEELRAYYYRRSRGLKGLKTLVPDSAASSGRSGGIETFDVSVDELVRRLEARVTIVPGRVLEVTSSGAVEAFLRVQGLEEPVRATRVINTLPAPIWDSLTPEFTNTQGFRDRREYSAGWKTWVVGKPFNVGIAKERRRGVREVLYNVEPALLFDRVKFLCGPPARGCVYEFNSIDAPLGFCEAVEAVHVGPSARVQVLGDSREAEEWGGLVRHVGRMARWDHAIRIHDVAEELYAIG